MENKRYHLAVDIGASSGRTILGYREDGVIKTEETFRFPNGVKEENGHLLWDMEALIDNVRKGIDSTLSSYPLSSIAIDTWGVDYVLLEGDRVIGPVYAYRDHRTESVIDEVHSLLPFSRLYEITGIQFQSFNTIYQLYRDKKDERLNGVTDFLMIPEFIAYALTGNKKKEYTNATTTGMVDGESGVFSKEIIDALSLPQSLFPSLSKPGEMVGEYKGIPLLLAPTHDTASAVCGIEMDGNEPYISSGTWSLLGLKVPSPLRDRKSMEGNWSNEGGVGYVRYQKNIMGMWLINRLKEELAPEISFSSLVEEARASSFDGFVDAASSAFLSPASMKSAFDEALGVKNLSRSDYFRSAILSLSKSYGKAIRELEENTGRKMKKLYIVGGGAGNTLLNELTEMETGLSVVARKMEATAIGNIKSQMEAFNEL